ncbi:MAG: tetratricopeptide repeat protein, partial [Ignavibacteriales bacterium]|nr:tetratricopeptide repeat protein [Ignavibacteriales bacterium]
MNNLKIKLSYFNLVLLALSVLAGCSTYQSATSYFNTYYNAKKQFDDAELELNKTPRADRDTNYFAPPSNKPGGGNSKFDKVIEKCSKLIQNYPESNLVDDAMLLIGKSGVYLGETELAIRKFNELYQNFPESELLTEAKLWNAKALFFSNKADDALRIIEELYPIAVETGEENIAIEAQMLAGQIFFKRGEYVSVIQHLEKAVELSGDDALLAIAQYQLAFCLDKINEYERAAAAYARIQKFNPDLTLAFRSQMRFGIMLTYADQIEEALLVFQELNDEPLKPEEQALVDHEVANAYAMLGDSTKAFDMYTYVDTTYKRTDAAARSYFRQGLLMEEQYSDFKKAKEYYEKAKSENQTSEIVTQAKKRSEYLTKYFSIRSNIKKYDSLFVYLVNEDSLKEVEKKKQLEAKAKLQDSLKNDSTFVMSDSLNRLTTSSEDAFGATIDSTTLKRIFNKTIPKDTTAVVQEIKEEPKNVTEEIVKQNEEITNQNEEQLKPNEAVNEHQVNETQEPVTEQVPEEIPQEEYQGVPRTLAEIRAERRDDEEETEEGTAPGMVAQNKTRKPGDTSKTAKGVVPPVAPQTSVGMTFDSLDVLRSKEYYELATLFLLDMNLGDSAQIMFEKVISDFPVSTYVPRSLYTLAEIYRTREDSCVTDSLYRIIHAEHKKSEYGRHLNKYFGEVEDTVKQVDSAEVKYSAINLFVDSTKALKTIENLEAFALEFPKSPYAMKAQYAIGWIYENVLMNFDSAASVYKKLMETFPSSEYALDAEPRVAVKDNPESIN